MYCSAIPLEYLMLKVGHQDYLYHQVTAYDHVIAYSQIAFFVVNMEAVINYLADRKIWHAKRHLDVMHCAVLYSTLLYCILRS